MHTATLTPLHTATHTAQRLLKLTVQQHLLRRNRVRPSDSVAPCDVCASLAQRLRSGCGTRHATKAAAKQASKTQQTERDHRRRRRRRSGGSGRGRARGHRRCRWGCARPPAVPRAAIGSLFGRACAVTAAALIPRAATAPVEAVAATEPRGGEGSHTQQQTQRRAKPTAPVTPVHRIALTAGGAPPLSPEVAAQRMCTPDPPRSPFGSSASASTSPSPSPASSSAP
jgi:hypothetical protein